MRDVATKLRPEPKPRMTVFAGLRRLAERWADQRYDPGWHVVDGIGRGGRYVENPSYDPRRLAALAAAYAMAGYQVIDDLFPGRRYEETFERYAALLRGRPRQRLRDQGQGILWAISELGMLADEAILLRDRREVGVGPCVFDEEGSMTEVCAVSDELKPLLRRAIDHASLGPITEDDARRLRRALNVGQ